MARELSTLLAMPVLDIDDDVLERNWGESVASKLRQLGDEAFLHKEAEELKTVAVERTVISLSGSVLPIPISLTSHLHLPVSGKRQCSSFLSLPVRVTLQLQPSQRRCHGPHRQQRRCGVPRLSSSQCHC